MSENTENRTFLCIDLKSFYASVECVARGLDPFEANLVVADPDRTDRTICLAISPAMKALGVPNRCRVFEIPPDIPYIMATPRMALYMSVSAHINRIYLRFVSAADMHVYSIDESFIDITPYLRMYTCTPRAFAKMLMDAVLSETGISATVGLGTNLFLAKVALDINAKHAPDRISFLDQAQFRRTVQHHRPITDIWNIGPGIAARLARFHVYDLAGIADLDEHLLYKEFGVNARYLIDHAHGVEPCSIADIKTFRPKSQSLSSGQVLPCAYTFAEGLVLVKEMAEGLALDLVERRLVAGGISLSVGAGSSSRKLPWLTDSARRIRMAFVALYNACVEPDWKMHRISLGLYDLHPSEARTIDLFTDEEALMREHSLQESMLAIKERFGGNGVFHGISLTEKATALERNQQIGGHRA